MAVIPGSPDGTGARGLSPGSVVYLAAESAEFLERQSIGKMGTLCSEKPRSGRDTQ